MSYMCSIIPISIPIIFLRNNHHIWEKHPKKFNDFFAAVTRATF